VRRLQKGVEHGGHQLTPGDLFGLDELQDLVRVERPFPFDHKGIGHVRVPHNIVFTGDVVHGKADEHLFVVLDPQLDDICDRVGHEMSVGSHSAFWFARRPGREEDADDIVINDPC
jgi:hypothetical protein